MGWSSTTTKTSTVSSPTTSGGVSSPERIVPVPAQLRSPSVGVFSPSKRHRGSTRQSSLRTTPATPSQIAPISPLLFASKSLPGPTTRTKHLPPTWLEVQSGSDDEVVVCTQSPAEGHNSPPSTHGSPVCQTAELGAEAGFPDTLPVVLAEITLDDSTLSRSGMCVIVSTGRKTRDALVLDFESIKRAILANPFYLGEPRHICLRNSKGKTTHRVMRTPPHGSPTPPKWYAVACGSQVGVFLSW